MSGHQAASMMGVFLVDGAPIMATQSGGGTDHGSCRFMWIRISPWMALDTAESVDHASAQGSAPIAAAREKTKSRRMPGSAFSGKATGRSVFHGSNTWSGSAFPLVGAGVGEASSMARK